MKGSGEAFRAAESNAGSRFARAVEFVSSCVSQKSRKARAVLWRRGVHIVVVDERVGKLCQCRKSVDTDVSGASFGAERSQRSVALSCCRGAGAGSERSESRVVVKRGKPSGYF